MKEHPILFSTPMVQAICDNRKRMTSRIIKVQPENDQFKIMTVMDNVGNPSLIGKHFWGKMVNYALVSQSNYFSKPYGQVGDVLWVREAWRLVGWNFEQGLITIEYKDGNMHICKAYDPNEDSMWLLDQVEALETKGYIKPSPTEKDAFVFTDKKLPFKPSIHMPKAAARIWLRITNIKVERLQDISEEDAMNEGVEYEWYDQSRNIKIEAAKSLFKKLWQVINGRESWEANPWVWAIEFEVLSTTGKPAEL